MMVMKRRRRRWQEEGGRRRERMDSCVPLDHLHVAGIKTTVDYITLTSVSPFKATLSFLLNINNTYLSINVINE